MIGAEDMDYSGKLYIHHEDTKLYFFMSSWRGSFKF